MMNTGNCTVSKTAATPAALLQLQCEYTGLQQHRHPPRQTRRGGALLPPRLSALFIPDDKYTASVEPLLSRHTFVSAVSNWGGAWED